MIEINNKKIKIFTDGANLDAIDNLSKNPIIDGITTNPTLMKKSGVTNYLLFSKSAFAASQGKSLSIEVLSNSKEGMIREAEVLSSIGNLNLGFSFLFYFYFSFLSSLCSSVIF